MQQALIAGQQATWVGMHCSLGYAFGHDKTEMQFAQLAK
jgi:hypothetical protein